MLTRILLFLIVIAATASVSHSQPAGDSILPEPCRVQRSEELRVLERRKQRLERTLALARAAKPAGDVAHAKTLSKSQTELLRVLFQIDCAKARRQSAQAAQARPEAARRSQEAPRKSAKAKESGRGGGRKSLAAERRSPMRWRRAPPAAAAPAPEAESGSTRSLRTLSATRASRKAGNALEVTTYFATNRGRTGNSQPTRSYDASVSALSYGRALVSIPSTHKPGSLELPSIWRLQFWTDPKRHFVLKEATALSADGARAEMAKALSEARSRSLLIFVHGYNMSFAETAMRTAQLAYDLNFRGIPFFFSWPSAGKITGYLRDAETAQLSEDAFDRVLDDLSLLPVEDVYVVAHSMGSRIVSQVLRARVDKGKPTAHLSELLLAAPDINAQLFRKAIAPRLKAMQDMQTTVYASSSDLALRASKAVYGYPRVGETADGVFVFPGLETIDASRATMAVRAFGHSYLTDSAAVLRDIRALLRKKLTAKQRGLAQVGASPNVYWSLR